MAFTRRWKSTLQERSYCFSLAFSLCFFALATVSMLLSGQYAEQSAAPALPDTIHNILPLEDVTFLATFGFAAVQLLFWGYFVHRPKELPSAMNIYALFILIRSLFIYVTPMGAPLLRIDDIPIANLLFSGLYFTKDLFPSGHVALPFLGFLLIKNKKLKWFMFWWSLVMGISVLLLHVHYTMDVLGAYFVAYGAKGLYGWGRKNVGLWKIWETDSKKNYSKIAG
ncbi:phosphatase PAP2 family protein [Candidatus Woesearchaeota archaeon]|nr:phosphatase PAP2 family protein [Candidatus Woesearchaeota archaeon]